MEKTIEKPRYFLLDAKGKILGRFASEAARILSGKNRVDYTPNVGGKDWVIVINSDEVELSGEKEGKKTYYRHSGYPGGIYKKTFEERMEEDSQGVIFDAVKGMMPKNKLSREALKRLRVFKDENHDFKDKIGN